MKKIIVVLIAAVIAGTSCQKKDIAEAVPLPEAIYLDVIAVDNNPDQTITQGPVVTIKVQP